MTRHWSACAWIACLAILFNAFAPMLSPAALASASAPTSAFAAAPLALEVCTAMGMEMMPMTSTGTDEPGGKPMKAMAHCECCMTHAAALGLPPPPLHVLALPVVRAAYPRLFYLAPRAPFVWSPAQARAPPSMA